MPTAENAKVMYEAGQDFNDWAALTDKGDHLQFDSDVNFWSKKSGYEADVKPNGLVSGCKITPAASGTNNLVDVAAGYAYIAGVLTAIAADTDVEVARPAGSGDDSKTSSVTITSAGAIAVVAGADHTDLSTTRGADGGPPWIPTTSIEIGQVKYSSDTAAAVLASEISQVQNTSLEMFDYPVWDEYPMRVENQVADYAGVTFNSALPQIHSDDAGSTTSGKKVYAKFYEPVMAELPDTENFVPPKNSHSVSSKQVYGNRTIGASSMSIGQGSFTVYTRDNTTDNILKLEDTNLFWKYFQDRLKSPYQAGHAKLGVAYSNPAGDNVSSACTLSAERKFENIAS